MESNVGLEQYQAAGHRQRFKYESHTGSAANDVHSLNGRNWSKVASYWYLVKAGVLMNIPKGVHLKLLSKQVRRECDAIIERDAMNLESAQEKADQYAAVSVFLKIGCTDANLKAS